MPRRFLLPALFLALTALLLAGPVCLRRQSAMQDAQTTRLAAATLAAHYRDLDRLEAAFVVNPDDWETCYALAVKLTRIYDLEQARKTEFGENDLARTPHPSARLARLIQRCERLARTDEQRERSRWLSQHFE